MTTCYSNIETCLTTMLLQQAWAPRSKPRGFGGRRRSLESLGNALVIACRKDS
ncbi:hypothetical protein Lbir_1527 [Legionella birminghamensis]|uniref:Transposase n=1 Tax=Legionella birminghamensis TaxID=28083 RepID=A0ABR5QIU8_9GAMM|nr:hypothetical protein Lbir_1527 [Legionella birminghamensis]